MIIGILLAGISAAGYFMARRPNSGSPERSVGGSANAGRWVQTENGWQAEGETPACTDPLIFAAIADLSRATSVLYPGQLRSVGYENTGGFRFDRSANDEIAVTAPLDGELVMAARFLVAGEPQFVLDILSPCGIMNRFDHLLTLSPKLQAVAEQLPPPKEDDTRSTPIDPPLAIAKGETLATAVGLRRDNNTFVAWTVFDFRQKNSIARENAAWAAAHPVMDHYAVCPYNFMAPADRELIAALPAADSMSGRTSDFCD